MFAAINNTRIFYDVDGASVAVKNGNIVHKPVVFVIHGGPGGTHVGFKPHLNELAKDAQLVFIDQRGCGYSDETDPESYTLEQNVEDIEALRQHLGLEKIYILGHSYGGMVAMSYGIKYEEHLAGLILVTTSPSYRFLEKAQKFIAENGNEDQKYYAQKLWDGSFQSAEELGGYYEAMAPLYSLATAKEEDPQPKPQVKRSYEPLNKGFGEFLRTFDLREGLKRISVPTLILAGRHDWITPVCENEEIHECIAGSEFHVLENSSHSVFVDENEKTLAYISGFLNK